MRVGIVGAGLAGLVCAYQLTKKGVDVVIYESQPYAGGKMRYNIGNINKSATYKYTIALIDELGLDVLYSTQQKNHMGILVSGKLVKLELYDKMQRFIPKMFSRNKHWPTNYLYSLDFDLFNPSDEVKRLRNMSFAKITKNAPFMDRMFALSTPDFLFEDNMDKVAADLGAYVLKHIFDTVNDAYVFEENLMPMALLLEDYIFKQGAEMHFNSDVELVSPLQTGGFKIDYSSHGEKYSDQVENVVLTLPLPLCQKVMPSMEIVSDVIYKPVVVYLTQGELRHPDRSLIIGMRALDKGNIRIFSTTLEYEHIIIPFDSEKDVDFNVLYKNNSCRVLKKQYLKYGWPVRGPKARVPELVTNIKGAYLCGDFYYYGLMETSVCTAQKVAELITSTPGGKS